MRPAPVLLGLALHIVVASPALAGSVLEGIVKLPPPSPAPEAYVRYPGVGPDDVGPAEPPAAIVWLEAVGEGSAAGRAEDMAQHRFQFEPGLVAVQKGATVHFPNRDEEYHSVFSYSKTKRFDLGRFARDEGPAEVVFAEPGVVRVYCEIHEHMRGTLVVVDSPFFVKTDAAGYFRLEGLPAGRFTVRAWVDDDDMREATVDLREGETAKHDFAAP